MKRFNVLVKKEEIALNVEDEVKVAKKPQSCGGLILKSQVHTGGRGKGGVAVLVPVDVYIEREGIIEAAQLVDVKIPLVVRLTEINSQQNYLRAKMLDKFIKSQTTVQIILDLICLINIESKNLQIIMKTLSQFVSLNRYQRGYELFSMSNK